MPSAVRGLNTREFSSPGCTKSTLMSQLYFLERAEENKFIFLSLSRKIIMIINLPSRSEVVALQVSNRTVTLELRAATQLDNTVVGLVINTIHPIAPV